MNQTTDDDSNSPPMSPVEQQQRRLQRELADKITECCDKTEINALLAMGAQVDGEVTRGLTPLHYACFSNNYDVAEFLILTGAKIDAADSIGCTALHLCAEYGYDSLVHLLLSHVKSISQFESAMTLDVNGKYPSRDTIDEPLRLAIKNGNVSTAQILLEAGATPNALYFDGPEITLLSPNDDYYIESLELLLKHGANPNVLNRRGLSPLMIAAKKGHRGIEGAKMLLKNGADINMQGSSRSDYRTALHYAVLSNSIELCTIFLEHGADIKLPDNYEKPSILDIAVLKDDPKLLKFVLDQGADPNRVYTVIGCALHLACCTVLNNQKEILTLLLERGADPNLQHKFSNGDVLKSPFVEYFRSRDLVDKNIVQLLLSFGAKVHLNMPSTNQCGQLRNIMKLALQGQQEIAYLMVDLAEPGVDLKAVLRLPILDRLKEKIINRTKTPPTLQQLCRSAFRQWLSPLRPVKVTEFPIPTHLKKYILGYY